ncbi:hypothetical protein BpHYR1_011325 [Brachionus plicatilis]|uniref:Secreted protein n=1 Tax=Brachionus plicatilis TaxID=10195 RepID=A0A3M7Q2R8_BRAPC|nr:hypothetical protein BpHYR1_011325 [Brachionus plicatilis]
MTLRICLIILQAWIQSKTGPARFTHIKLYHLVANGLWSLQIGNQLFIITKQTVVQIRRCGKRLRTNGQLGQQRFGHFISVECTAIWFVFLLSAVSVQGRQRKIVLQIFINFQHF